LDQYLQALAAKQLIAQDDAREAATNKEAFAI